MKLVLLIQHTAPEIVQQAWTTLKQWLMLFQTNREHYFSDIANHTQLEINQTMVVLHRTESGLGDQQDNVGRQIRLLDDLWTTCPSDMNYFGKYGSLCFILSDDRYKRWTNDQINDMICSIVGVTNIILKKSTTYDDNGLSVYKVERVDEND